MSELYTSIASKISGGGIADMARRAVGIKNQDFIPPAMSDTKREAEYTWNVDDNNKYSVRSYCYPEDVTSSADLQHSVVFYINVRGKSKYKTEINTFPTALDADTVTNASLLAASAAVTAATVGVIGAKGLTGVGTTRRIAMGGSLMGSALTEGKKAMKEGAGVIAAGIGVAAVAASFSPSTMYRLKDAITLAVQTPMKANYKVHYETYDAGTMLGGISPSALLGGELPQAELLKVLQIPGAVGGVDFARGVQKMAGVAVNPFRTALFQSVDLRTFNYSYKFMPKTAAEAANVRRIINIFRFHMHPEFSTDKIFLIHPSEFNIVYYYKGQENSDNWHKISTCVLTDMEIDQGEERLATFTDGMSVEINMRLTFMETEMMTKEKIQQGY